MNNRFKSLLVREATTLVTSLIADGYRKSFESHYHSVTYLRLQHPNGNSISISVNYIELFLIVRVNGKVVKERSFATNEADTVRQH